MSLNEANVLVSTYIDEVPTYASHVPVPNVQETVRNNPLKVPERYVRSEEEIQKVLYMPQLSSQVPIIDFTLLSHGNKDEILKLDIACKEWGFFQVYLL